MKVKKLNIMITSDEVTGEKYKWRQSTLAKNC